MLYITLYIAIYYTLFTVCNTYILYILHIVDYPPVHTLPDRNITNKMAPLLHFVNGPSHIAVKVQQVTMSYGQS